ncbi:hypothetical protein [Altererythrobacter sp. MF3-039]|uniref:hypothetical protein n=1 Tax=Altererythrobacter sp. MF3-039 TaxID=3252901 RepID=UPI00390C75C0
MINPTFFFAAIFLAQSAPAAPQLSLEQQAALRCSAAFALVSHGQEIGNADAMQFPKLEERGREFMVQSMAKLMDETGLDRDSVAALLSAEAQSLFDDGRIVETMPACLALLDASGI